MTLCTESQAREDILRLKQKENSFSRDNIIQRNSSERLTTCTESQTHTQTESERVILLTLDVGTN